jgi:hypothetical protein
MFLVLFTSVHYYHHHHHKHPGLGHLARSVSRVTVVLSIVSLVSQLFFFLVGCSKMILKGFGFVAFFAGVKANFFCIHLCPCIINNSLKPTNSLYVTKVHIFTYNPPRLLRSSIFLRSFSRFFYTN